MAFTIVVPENLTSEVKVGFSYQSKCKTTKAQKQNRDTGTHDLFPEERDVNGIADFEIAEPFAANQRSGRSPNQWR